MSTGGVVPRRSRRRTWWLIAAVLTLVLLGLAGWVAWKGSVAYVGLRDAQDSASRARDAISTGDAVGAVRQLDAMSESLARARDATSDPVWGAASSLPWLGANLSAVTGLTAALDDLARDGVAPVADIAATVASGGLAPSDGRIDLGPLVAAGPALDGAAAAGERAAADIARIDSGALLPLVGEQVDLVREEVTSVASALRTGARVADLLPPMLGVDGERRYLALFLNSAELRASGGLVGALAVITADDGQVSLGAMRAGTDLPRFAQPILPLTAAEREVHGVSLGRIIQNVALTPDFPRTAELAAAMWEEDTGERVDGVIATDVLALAKVLAGTGPVTTGDGTRLESGTVVEQLLHAPYLRFKRQDRADAFFADAAGRVFAKIVTGDGDVGGVIDGLASASGEGRVLVWSTDAAEQEGLQVAGLSGAFLSGAAPRAGGIFLNDVTGGKLDYFLDSSVEVARVTCDDGMAVTTRVRLGSRVPAAEAEAFPEYVTGMADVPPGTFLTRIAVYSPVGGELRASMRDGASVGGRQTVEGDREVNLFSLTLAPGETVTYEFTWRVPDVGAVEVWSTPTTTSPGRINLPGSCAA